VYSLIAVQLRNIWCLLQRRQISAE